MRTPKFPEWHQSQGNWAARRNDDMAQLVTVLQRKPHATQWNSLCTLRKRSCALYSLSFIVRTPAHTVLASPGKPKLSAEKLLGVERRLRRVTCPMIHQEGTALVFAMYSILRRAVPGQMA